MPKIRLLSQSLESVTHQRSTKLFRELVVGFSELRELDHVLTGVRSDRAFIEASNIESSLKRYTGLNVRLFVHRFTGLGAAVLPPPLDRNHPLNTETRRIFSNGRLSADILESKEVKSFQGSIDLERAQVGGVFSKIQAPISMGTQLVQSDIFSVEEVAAIFLHECGHLMSYYEYLGRSVVLSHVLGDVVRQYTEQESMKQRIEIIDHVSHALDIDSIDARRAAEIRDGDILRTLIVTEAIERPVSATNTRTYDERTWEALADQFVSRMGAGRYLAIGLDRRQRMAGSAAYRTNLKHLMVESTKGLLAAVPMFTPLFILALMSGNDPKRDDYDGVEIRLKRVRQDIVQAMKDPKLDKSYRLRLQEDADVIADLLKHVNDRESFYSYLWTRLRPSARSQLKRTNMIQELETMANNELFVKANQLTLKAEGENHA